MSDTDQAGAAPAPKSGEGGGMSAARTSMAIIAARIITQLSQLALFIVAARQLGPEDFGAFALLFAVMMILTRFTETGWGEYLIAWRETDRPPTTIFTCALTTAFVMAAIGGAGAYALRLWLESPIYSDLLALLLIALFPGVIMHIQTNALIRRQKAMYASFSTAIADLIALGVGVWFLLEGYGLYALAIHKIVNVSILAVLTTLLGRHSLALGFDGRIALDAFRFARNVIAARIVDFTRIYAADFAIAALLGLREVGLYRAGARIVSAVNEMVSEPATTLSWALLGQAARSPQPDAAIPRTSAGIATMLILVASPVFLGVAAISGTVVELVFGPDWAAAGPVVLLLATARWLNMHMPMTSALFGVLKKSKLIARLQLMLAATSLIALFSLGWMGLAWAAASQLLAAGVALPLAWRLMNRETPLRLGAILAAEWPLLALAVAMALSVYFVADPLAAMGFTNVETLLAQIGLGMTIYGLGAVALRPSLIGEVLRDLTRRGARG